MALFNEFHVWGTLIADPVVVSTDDNSVIKIYIDCVHKELDPNGVFLEHKSVIPVSIYSKHEGNLLNLVAGAVVGIQGHIKGTFHLVTGRHTIEFVAAADRVAIGSPLAPNRRKPNGFNSSHQKKFNAQFIPAVA
jgi:hypothetical protein